MLPTEIAKSPYYLKLEGTDTTQAKTQAEKHLAQSTPGTFCFRVCSDTNYAFAVTRKERDGKILHIPYCQQSTFYLSHDFNKDAHWSADPTAPKAQPHAKFVNIASLIKYFEHASNKIKIENKGYHFIDGDAKKAKPAAEEYLRNKAPGAFCFRVCSDEKQAFVVTGKDGKGEIYHTPYRQEGNNFFSHDFNESYYWSADPTAPKAQPHGKFIGIENLIDYFKSLAVKFTAAKEPRGQTQAAPTTKSASTTPSLASLTGQSRQAAVNPQPRSATQPQPTQHGSQKPTGAARFTV